MVVVCAQFRLPGGIARSEVEHQVGRFKGIRRVALGGRRGFVGSKAEENWRLFRVGLLLGVVAEVAQGYDVGSAFAVSLSEQWVSRALQISLNMYTHLFHLVVEPEEGIRRVN